MVEEIQQACPYCGETITLLVDCSVAEQEYVEDCSVCCCPIVVAVEAVDGFVSDMALKRECD